MSDILTHDMDVSIERVDRLHALVAGSGMSKGDIFSIIARDVVANSLDHSPVSMACTLPHAVNRFYAGLGFDDAATPTFAMATVGVVLGFLGAPWLEGMGQWTSNYAAGVAIRGTVDHLLETSPWLETSP